MTGVSTLSFFLWAIGPAQQPPNAGGRADEPDPRPRVVLPDESRYTPSAADGKGRASVVPREVEAASPVTLAFEFETAATGIAVGGGVAMNVSKFWGWTPPQFESPDQPGYTTVRCGRPEVALEAGIAADPSVLVVRVAGDNPLQGGDKLTIIYGDTADGKHPGAAGHSDYFAEHDERFFFKVDGDGDSFFTALEKQPRFDVVARNAAALLAHVPSQVVVGEPFEVVVGVVDPVMNRVESFKGEITLRIEGVKDSQAPHDSSKAAATPTPGSTSGPSESDDGSKPTSAPQEGDSTPRPKNEKAAGSAAGRIQAVLRSADRGVLRVPFTVSQAGSFRLIVEESKGRLTSATTNPSIAHAKKNWRYGLYWADLHSHSNVSDGTGSPRDLFEYARDVAGLDVYALTDHDYWGYQPLYSDAETWKGILDLGRAFNQPSRFVTFPGYEWTNWTFGHHHVLFMREEEAVIYPWSRPESDHPKELRALLGERDCLTIPHHPGGGPVPVFWKEWNERFEPVVEIASVHGVSEQLGHPRCIYSPEPSGMVQSALARGCRLGIIGSGDTHDGHPGMGSPGKRAALAGIYAKELTRGGIFEALRARRVYATTGCRAILRFTVNGSPMGSGISLSQPKEPREIIVRILAEDAVDSITVVKNNKPILMIPGGETYSEATWADEEPAQRGDYYYARIGQRDDEWIWSSPIWIDAIGVAAEGR